MRFVEWQGGLTATWLVDSGEHEERCVDEVPLVVVPGGPGLPHGYLSTLAGLAEPGRPVVFYDPVGCGRSERNGRDGRGWDVSLFVDELGTVLDRLVGAGGCAVLGHSSGGWVVLEALLGDASLRSRVTKVVLASVPLDVPSFRREQRRLIRALGVRHGWRLGRKPPTRGRRSRAYQRSYQAFLLRHVCGPPWPPELIESTNGSARDVYTSLWGPSEVWATGAFASWSCEDRLGGLTMPILLTSGRHDEVTPVVVERAVEQLPNAHWQLFENSAHMPHLEQTSDYLDAVRSFLST
jgi:L-proline amide hydrolase